jgi:hypothetical protein
VSQSLGTKQHFGLAGGYNNTLTIGQCCCPTLGGLSACGGGELFEGERTVIMEGWCHGPPVLSFRLQESGV